MQENDLKKGVEIKLKSKRFSFNVSGNSLKGFESAEKNLEKFLKVLEKKIPGIIWYVGTDLVEDRLCERFMFSKSGFMEIFIDKESEIRAFFPNKKIAERFIRGLRKSFIKLNMNIKMKDL